MYYIDCTLFGSEGEYIPVDDVNGNVYLDMNQQHFNYSQLGNFLGAFHHGLVRPINLIARRVIQIDDVITLKVTNTPSSQNFVGLPNADHNNAIIMKHMNIVDYL